MTTKGSFFELTGPSYVGTNPASSSNDGAIGVVIDGGGSVISTGVQADIEIPFGCTINSVTLLADVAGSVVVDVWNAAFADYPPTVANTICAAALPTLTSAMSYQDTTLTGWTTAVASNSVFRININSVTSITRLSITFKITKG